MGETKVLSNGAIYDMQKKRIVTVKPELAAKSTQITPATASEYHAKRQERKRERIQAGALAAVRDKLPDKFEGEGDDWVEAIAEAITYKALDRLDPKQVDAARFLLQETGLSEAKQAQQQGDAVTVTLSAQGLQALAAILAGDNNNYRKHDIIEGEAGEADSGGEKQ